MKAQEQVYLTSIETLRILLIFSDGISRTTKEIVHISGLNKSAVIRHLRTLTSSGFLVKTENKLYKLGGEGLAKISLAYVNNNLISKYR